MLDKILRFSLEHKLVVFLVIGAVVVWGMIVAPFDWRFSWLERSPVAVDAIPDIGENQQVVFTDWMGRSPQDVEDQVTYPLTAALLGIPRVKTIRSLSMFGFSSIFIIFEEGAEFYWTRSRVLEKLNSLPPGTLPEGVAPRLGPDATALGQVFWYTIEGRDEKDKPTGGWALDELRTIQDFTVRLSLQAVSGVAEVASIGGHVREYQVDVDPDLLRHFGVSLEEVAGAVRMANLDVGARTIEINRTEHIVRAVGFIKTVEDIEAAVVKAVDGVPISVRQVARVTAGPALREGALDKEGAEAVGGVVVVRYGSNPLAAIQGVKERITELSSSLPSKVLADGTVSKATIVPFYDRSGLILETLGTLQDALTEEILVTILVVIAMVMHFASSLLISMLLPIAVFITFIAMRYLGVDANIVALSGIAIAIGTMVDMGIVITENILQHLADADPKEKRLEVIFRAASEVGSAVLTAVMTTVVGFLPVFAMTGAEGKLFRPLAYTKTFALVASIGVALFLIPPLAHLLFGRSMGRRSRVAFDILMVLGGLALGIVFGWRAAGAALMLWGGWRLAEPFLPAWSATTGKVLVNLLAVAVVAWQLSVHWEPMGVGAGEVRNLFFVVAVVGGLLGFFWLFRLAYPTILEWALGHKLMFLSVPVMLIAAALVIWSGLQKEFMPPLDEGSFLLMPTTMSHASFGEAKDILRSQDLAIRAIPEVETVVGKIGRANSALDPAPPSMMETVITYVPEYRQDKDGRHLRFKADEQAGGFLRDSGGELIPDPEGKPFRQWRPDIRSASDIWAEIQDAAHVPGATMAPRLQPIAARIVMLQTGMRAPMGVKVKGRDLETIERVGIRIQELLKQVDGVRGDAVNADRIVGKPYLEIRPDREALARFGVHMNDLMEIVETAVGGMTATTTVEGRERYSVRVRYSRELRDSPEALERILVAAPNGTQIPLGQVASLRYVRGPQEVKSEDTFLVGYVTFDRKEGYGEVDVVESARDFLKGQEKVFEDALKEAAATAARHGTTPTSEEIATLPGLNTEGTSYAFSGNYENQVRSEKTLALVLPAALLVIFLILYLQFRSISTTLMVFSGIAVAGAGGFVLIWLYAQPWFLDATVFGANLRDLFQVRPINLSVAVWVGFIALFGIASDDGVVIATYLTQTFEKRAPSNTAEVRKATLDAGLRRLRPCLMTTATTILALLPVLTSTGRGADIMMPMAIPSFGGMTIELITLFVVPVLFAGVAELRLRFTGRAT